MQSLRVDPLSLEIEECGYSSETTSWCGSPATFFGTQYHKAIAFFVFLLEVPNLIYLHVYSC